jgi:hypothetical protein
MKPLWLAMSVVSLVGCAPGYIKSSDLEARDQGPTACAKSCEDIGMRMTALVLVGNEQPGCVCQPVAKESPNPLLQPPAPPAGASQEGAAASTTGYVVIAAADAARRQSERQRQQQQQFQQK